MKMGCALLISLALLLRSSSGSPVLLRPDCPSSCPDGVEIPYPFGVSDNCSLPGFRVACYDSQAWLISSGYWIQDISISKAKVQIRKSYRSICNSSLLNFGLNLSHTAFTVTAFTVSPTDNEFVVVGCNTVTLLEVFYAKRSYGTGCISYCKGQEQMVDGNCTGIGCCRTDLRYRLDSYRTFVKSFSETEISNITSSTCARPFLVKKGNYTFRKQDIDVVEDEIRYPVVLDWAIGNKSCEEAMKNMSSFACKSNNSECLPSASGVGYICNCSQGYSGNPYLHIGCQDIDECKDSRTYPCYGKCQNTAGNYYCTCPLGSTSEDPKIHPCKSENGTTQHHGYLTGPIFIGTLSSTLAVFLLIVSTFLFCRRLKMRRREKRKEMHFQQNYDMLLTQQRLVCPLESENMANKVKFYSLNDIEKATGNFDASHVAGQGGHGTVYKGLIDLRVVAIKKSNVSSMDEIKQFLNEIILLSMVIHRNVVRLVGCCLETEVPLLVYEFIANGTLAHHLRIWNRENPPLPWDDRLRIAIEIAGALAYLHSAANISIFHRDIKSSNILLDDKLSARLSDFGASKCMEIEQTHVSCTNVQGTFGYLDPEYLHTGQLTDKSDVYSLGVILVELLTGENPSSRMRSQEDGNLVSQFRWAFQNGTLFRFVEASIVQREEESNDNREEIEKVARLAVECLRINGAERPTMKTVELRWKD